MKSESPQIIQFMSSRPNILQRKMNITFVLVPLLRLHFPLLCAKGFCLFSYLEVSVKRFIYTILQVQSECILVLNISFFNLICPVKWTFFICTKMLFDIQFFCPLLRIVLLSAMRDEKCSRCYFGYLSMPLTITFYNAALYVLPETPFTDGLLYKSVCNFDSSHHV